MDEAAAVKNLKQFKTKVKRTAVLPIAAAFDQGLEEFKNAIRKAVETPLSQEVRRVRRVKQK